MNRMKEVIVVEGRDDEANIKMYVDAEVIITHGFGISKGTFERIQFAAQTVGIIILTDPDFAGEQIRKNIVNVVSGNIKHAYITRLEGDKNGNIGVENASKDAILKALKAAKGQVEKAIDTFSIQDMYTYGLMGREDSRIRRMALGKVFRIGYGNAKQIRSRLNKYNISKEDVNRWHKAFKRD